MLVQEWADWQFIYKGMLYKAMKINKPQLHVQVDDFQM